MAFRRMKMVPIFRRFLSMRRPNNNYTSWQWNNHRHFSSRRSLVPEWIWAGEIVENRMRQIDREMSWVFDELQQMSSFVPRLFDVSGSSSRTRNIPVIRADEAGSRVYRIDVDLQGLEPEDIQITLKDSTLTIRGKKEVIKEDGSHHHRDYSYQYTVPSEVDPDTVRSYFEKGVLKIEAPLPKLEQSTKAAKEIPVHVEGKKQ